MVEPCVERDGFHEHAFHDAPRPHAHAYLHLLLLRQLLKLSLVLRPISLEARFDGGAVICMRLVQPFGLVHHVVSVHDHEPDVEVRLVLPHPPHELVDESIVAVEHVVVRLEDVVGVVPANALVPPAPEVERHGAVFSVLCEVLGEDVEVAVLVDREAIVESDFVIHQISAPVHLAVYERGVHVVVDVERLRLVLRVAALLAEARYERVEPALHLAEHDVKAAHVAEHVVGVAEHDVIRRRCVKRRVAGMAHTAFVGMHVLYLERVPLTPFCWKRRGVGAIVGDDDANVGHVDALLQGD